jgi:O-antigen/teichoic acid export membrane protein
VIDASPPTGRGKVAAHAGVTFAGLTAANVLAYVFYALVSRSIGVEPYGTFSALVAVVLILSTPALIAQMVIAKLASDLALDPERLAGLVHAIDRVTLGAAGVAGFVLVAASVPVAAFLHIPDPLLVTLAGCSLAAAIVMLFLRGVLQGSSQFGAFALSNVVETGAKAVLAPALGLVAGVRGAMAGTAAGYAVAAVYTFVAAMPHRRGTPVPFSLRAVARTSAAVGLAVFCVNFLVLYDGILAKRYLDAHTTGLYGAASLAGRALYSAIAFVPVVLLPQAALRAARRERTRWLLLQALGVAAAIVAAAVAFFAFFGQPVIMALTTPAFRGAAPFLVPYMYAIGVMALANIVATYNIARGRMGFIVPLALVALGETASIVLRHRSVADFLQTIVVGHTLALLATATSLGTSRRSPPAAEPELTIP